MKLFDHTGGEYLEIGDAKIYYEVTGKADSPVLLALHGGFGNLEDLNDILGGLTAGFRIVAMDLRGHGKSTLGSAKLTYERMQQDAEKVLEHLQIKTLSILGFSDGGIVAYRLAALSPLNIEKVVTISARWHFDDALATKEILAEITADSWREKYPKMYNNYQQYNPQPDFELLTTSLADMWLDGELSGYPNERIQKIICPLLIVRGDDDFIIPRKSAVKLSENIYGASLLNIPFAGHIVFKDQPVIFNIVLNEFFNMLPAISD